MLLQFEGRSLREYRLNQAISTFTKAAARHRHPRFRINSELVARERGDLPPRLTLRLSSTPPGAYLVSWMHDEVAGLFGIESEMTADGSEREDILLIFIVEVRNGVFVKFAN